MMPPPVEVAAFVDGAEQLAVRFGDPIMQLSREHRRRLLAWAAFEYLRHDWEGAWTPEPLPVPA